METSNAKILTEQTNTTFMPHALQSASNFSTTNPKSYNPSVSHIPTVFKSELYTRISSHSGQNKDSLSPDIIGDEIILNCVLD